MGVRQLHGGKFRHPLSPALVSRSGVDSNTWTSPGSNPRANVTAVKRWLNPGNSWITSGQQYDVLGNVVKTVDPLGNGKRVVS